MKHIAVYVRVSSRQQQTESQEPDLQKWISCNANGQHVKLYHDKFSGKTMDRPGWNELHSAIKAGEVSAVVCWRLDRLGRTASGLTKLFEELSTRRVNLISLKDGLDLSTPAGRLMANVLAAVAQFETEVRGERVLAGQASARAKGKRWGGSSKGRRLSVTKEQVATIKRMASEGATKAAMARATGLTRPTIYRLLSE